MSLSLVAADGSTTHARRWATALALWLSACAPEPAPPARRPAPPPRPSVAMLGFAEAPGLATLVAESSAWREPPEPPVGLRVQLQAAGPAREVWSGESSPDELLNALSAAGEAVSKALNRPRPTPGRPHAELPRLPEAARLYATELELLRGHEPRHAADSWRRQGERDAMAWAEAVRALALLGAAREADADAARARAAGLAASSEQARVRLRVGLIDAWMQATTTGRVGAALEQIESLRREAARRGLLGIRLEARLLAARLELRFGRERSGRGLLVAVARDARTAGFLALARRAEHDAGPEQP